MNNIVFENIKRIRFEYPKFSWPIRRVMSPGYIGTTATITNNYLKWNSFGGLLDNIEEIHREGDTLVIKHGEQK